MIWTYTEKKQNPLMSNMETQDNKWPKCRICGSFRFKIITEVEVGSENEQAYVKCQCSSCDNQTEKIIYEDYLISLKTTKELIKTYIKINEL